MRIALLSPLPPSPSGIADYTTALAASLERIVTLDIFGSADGLPDLSAYDAVIYQVGNNDAHGFVYDTALAHPGIVVLHEANLHHLIAEITIKRGDWNGYMQAVEYDGGAAALAYAQAVRRLEVGPDYDGVPMLKKLLRRARGLIAHSNYVVTIAREQGYQGPAAVIPHGAWLPERNSGVWRDELGVPDGTTLIGVFGHLKPYKRIAETLRAFRRLSRENPFAKLLLVGQEHPDLPLQPMLESLDLAASVRHIGNAPIERFVGYMDACDIIVNLRYPTVGESSGSMLRALGLGKPVLVSEVGSFAEFPDHVCVKIPTNCPAEEDLIFEYLRYLVANPEAARILGEGAREWVAGTCNWDRVAELYRDFAEQVARGPAEVSEEDPRGDFSANGESARSIDEAVVTVAVRPPTEAPAVRMPETEAGCVADDVAYTGSEADAAGGDLAGEEAGGNGPVEQEEEPEPAAEQPDSSLDHPLAQELLAWVPNEAARGYLLQHLSRLIMTLEMLPDGEDEHSILEMGCYMQLTPALREWKHYASVRGCYYGRLGTTRTQSATAHDGREFHCTIDEFDAERDRYPYEDESFDAVLCTELFEHLGHDPMHCLAEVNRILKPGGRVLLSTPNVCSERAIAAILEGYHPGFFPSFMRPTADGEVDPRHHREYAPREVAQALDEAGFSVERLETGPYWSAPTPEHAWVRHLLERYRADGANRGECIFALAKKTGSVRNRYPDWLYYG